MELSEALEAITAALRQRKCLIVVGCCSVSYVGRAASRLGEGDRVVIVKGDGSFIVHGAVGLAPLNYHGAGAETSVALDGNALVLASRRWRGGVLECIEARFRTIADARAFELRRGAVLRVVGDERELAAQLRDRLDAIEVGLVPLRFEGDVRSGLVDILAMARDGALVAIELKRRRAGLGAVAQLVRYVKELRCRRGVVVRGVLCAPGISDRALALLRREGLEWRKLSLVATRDGVSIKDVASAQRAIDEY